MADNVWQNTANNVFRDTSDNIWRDGVSIDAAADPGNIRITRLDDAYRISQLDDQYRITIQ